MNGIPQPALNSYEGDMMGRGLGRQQCCVPTAQLVGRGGGTGFKCYAGGLCFCLFSPRWAPCSLTLVVARCKASSVSVSFRSVFCIFSADPLRAQPFYLVLVSCCACARKESKRSFPISDKIIAHFSTQEKGNSNGCFYWLSKAGTVSRFNKVLFKIFFKCFYDDEKLSSF